MDHIFRYLPFRDLVKKSPVSAFLVVSNIAIFVIGYILNEFFDFRSFTFSYGMATWFIDVRGEYYRFISAGFIHANLLHLGFNVMFGIYLISAGVERLIGSFKFSIAYLISLIGSSFVVYYFSDSPFTITVGASGAIYGMLGVLLYITLVKPDMISRHEAASIKNIIFINIIFTFLASGISVSGHLGGLAVGLLISYILLPQRSNRVTDDRVYDFTNDDEKDDDENWWDYH